MTLSQKVWYQENKERIEAKRKEYRKANKEKVAAQRKAYYEKTKDRDRERSQASSRRYTAANREKIAMRRKRPKRVLKTYLYEIKKKYGLSESGLRDLQDSQRGCCPVCCNSLDHLGILNVDHCHKSGVVRGLLCSYCNQMLGFSLDKPNTLRRGATYLEENQ